MLRFKYIWPYVGRSWNVESQLICWFLQENQTNSVHWPQRTSRVRTWQTTCLNWCISANPKAALGPDLRHGSVTYQTYYSPKLLEFKFKFVYGVSLYASDLLRPSHLRGRHVPEFWTGFDLAVMDCHRVHPFFFQSTSHLPVTGERGKDENEVETERRDGFIDRSLGLRSMHHSLDHGGWWGLWVSGTTSYRPGATHLSMQPSV